MISAMCVAMYIRSLVLRPLVGSLELAVFYMEWPLSRVVYKLCSNSITINRMADVQYYICRTTDIFRTRTNLQTALG